MLHNKGNVAQQIDLWYHMVMGSILAHGNFFSILINK